MAAIEPLAEASSPTLLEAARDLFRAYAAFLRQVQACHAFNFSSFDDEIRTLPLPYTTADGELLLALADPATPVGCIAFRSAPPASDPGACELKRLFVLPTHRGEGIAEHLVQTALDHARFRGYRTVILDTEPFTMQAANHLYRKLGFTSYTPSRPHNPVNVTYLRKDLLQPPAPRHV